MQLVLQSELPVLVVVTAKGGGTDLISQKTLERWVPQAGERLRILRLNAESSPELAERLRIPLASGLALFSRGGMCYQFIGEPSRRELDELLVRASSLGMD